MYLFQKNKYPLFTYNNGEQAIWPAPAFGRRGHKYGLKLSFQRQVLLQLVLSIIWKS